MKLPLGAVVDRYKVLDVLGEGGMAVVYKVRHVELETLHALKVMSLRGKALSDRLLQEGRIQAQVRHPNIVAVTDVIRIDGLPGLVMELIDGPPLDVLLRTYQPTLAQIDDLASGILAGVEHAHKHGLIHRDLKPGNVLVVVEGDRVVPKVTDFGLAKYLVEDANRLVAPTRTGVAMGTPTFMAPEQFKNAKEADGRADVFSLGALLYELVTGAPAFAPDNVIDVYQRMKAEEYRKVRAWRSSVPDRMERAIEGALRAEPQDRWQSASHLLDAWRGTPEEPIAPANVAVWASHQVAVVKSTPRMPSIVEPAPEKASPTIDIGAPAPTLTPDSLPWPPPAPPPPQPSTVPRFVGGAFAVIGVAALLGLGIGATVALFYVVFDRDEPAPAATSGWVVVETPAPAPDPVPAAPEPVVVATAPAPEETIAVTTAPSPMLTIRPVPSPAPAPVEPQTVYVPPPAPSTVARVGVHGVERAYLVDRAGARVSLGDVDPGTYHLLAFFDPADPTLVLQDIVLSAGETRVFDCNAFLRVCK